MIIDSHYHYMTAMSEKGAAEMVQLIYHEAKKMGMNPDYETLLKTAAQTWGDPLADRLIDKMDEAGIDVTIAMNVDNSNFPLVTPEKIQRQNRMLGEAVLRHPGRIIGLAGIDPRRPEAAEMARVCFEEYGLRGIKYHPDHGFDPAGPESYKVLEILARHKGVLLTHTGPLMPKGRCKFAEPLMLADIAVDFPEIKVIAAHLGGYINWRPWASLAAFQANMHGDLAVWDTLAYKNYDLFCRQLREVIDLVGPAKILFGSDAPVQTLLYPIKTMLQFIRDLPQKAPASIHFTVEEVNLILGGNAKAIFGLADASS
ncbi:MAG: amidohydrolase [Syntrophaceae bacterium]|nr:MAG: amidohydrolase [Syntrophaceae bacterium]